MGNGALVQAKEKGTKAVEIKKGTKYISDVLLEVDKHVVVVARL